MSAVFVLPFSSPTVLLEDLEKSVVQLSAADLQQMKDACTSEDQAVAVVGYCPPGQLGLIAELKPNSGLVAGGGWSCPWTGLHLFFGLTGDLVENEPAFTPLLEAVGTEELILVRVVESEQIENLFSKLRSLPEGSIEEFKSQSIPDTPDVDAAGRDALPVYESGKAANDEGTEATGAIDSKNSSGRQAATSGEERRARSKDRDSRGAVHSLPGLCAHLHADRPPIPLVPSKRCRIPFDVTSMTYEEYCERHYSLAIEKYRQSKAPAAAATGAGAMQLPMSVAYGQQMMPAGAAPPVPMGYGNYAPLSSAAPVPTAAVSYPM